MKKFIYKNIKSILVAIVVISLFIFFSWLSRQYAEELAASPAASNIIGPFGYFVIAIISVVIAGLSASPLIPLAGVLWGPVATVLLTSFGWTTGSMIAFVLARKYGEKFVCRIVNKCDFDDYRDRVKTKGLFWQLLIARIFLPVDIISYVVGLFTKMAYLPFFFSTLIGSALFTVGALYISDLPVLYQVLLGFLLLFIFFYKIQGFIKLILYKKSFFN